ncbi:hypothetical protein [Mycobacterium leprae]|uniref:hypothetical protein n=1 Tax=Mycobacterium leprae TaxID=1769 RepID=UPI0002D4A83B|nr:hypothetical protein [Mycobacterium leprae]
MTNATIIELLSWGPRRAHRTTANWSPPQVGPCEFMLFGQIDHDAWISTAGIDN